jgi:hypothetical protein
VKITITVSAELKATLDRYAEIHSQANGEKSDVGRLIPFMLHDFMENDREFRKVSGRSKANT